MSNSAFYAGKNWCRVAFTISIFATVAMLGSTAYAATLVAGGRAALPAPASGTIPVDHFLLYPNFRGMLFDDKPQTIQDMVEMNTASYPSGATVRATVETMGGSVLMTQTIPFSTTNTTVTFDGTSLALGNTYNVYVRLYNGSGSLLYTQTPYVISKMAGSLRTGMKFFIDENNHAWIRGQEIFPLGVYDSNFTLVNSSNIGSYQEYPYEFSQPFDLYLNFYQSDPGLSVANTTGQLINSKNGANWMGTDTGITCGGSTAATPASYFSSYASSQYTLGYYLIDEPGTDCVPGMFQTTKNNAAGDPASFSWPALNGNNNTNFGAPTASNLSFYKQFRDTFDIAGSDPYPNFNCTTEFCQAQYNVGDQTAQLNQSVYNARPNWMVMQYFMFNVLGPGHWPTQKELRSSAYMALTDGATGLFWWDMGNSPDASMPSWNDLLASNPSQAQQEWTWLKGVMAEVKGLQAPLLAPNAAAVGVSGVSAGTIHTMTKQVGNQFYVFAYNYTASSVTPTFTLPMSPSGNITVYSEGRTITPSGSMFTDTFTTYAPHVYVITTGSGGPDTTPPTASITSPASGSSFTVGTSIPVNVSASDNVGVVKTEFYVDGSLLATNLSSPWGFTWNTTGASATTHTLTVKAYDAANNVGTSAGVSVTLTTTVTLSATASASPTSGVAPLAVSFTGSASGGTSPYTYSWNFGDGSAASTAQNPSHTYSTAGTYTATLTANDSAAHTASAMATVAVSSAGTGGIPRSNHVFMVLEENTGYSAVVGNTIEMPYYNSLITKGALANNYYANSHPSLPNYLWMTSGSNNGVTGDVCGESPTFPSIAADNMVRHMISSGVTWREYAEDLPSIGYMGCSSGLGYYDTDHSPFRDYTDVQNSTAQQNNLVPFTQFAGDLAGNSLAQFNFLTPNMVNDGHNCPNFTGSCNPSQLKNADNWLKNNIQPLLNSPMFQPGGDGILIIMWDEGDLGDSTNGGGQDAWLVIGPQVKVNYQQQSATLYQHQSTLRTVMKALGMTSFPQAAATAPDMNEFFAAGSTSTPPFVVTASASPTSGVAPLAVNFTGSASGGTSPYTYSWNFGDGSAASTAQNPSHTYSTAGTYTATLTANDSAAHTASASQTITVTSAPIFDFSLVSNGNISVTQGNSVTRTVTATLSSGSTQSVSFSVGGLPTGASGSFSPASCSPTCSSTLTITTSASTPAGSYTVTVTGAGGGMTHTTTFTLTVTTAADTIPPTASITSPASGSSFTVGTSIPVNVSASDNVGVVKAEFYVDGTLLATSNASPWGFTWNTTGASATTHTLTVKAYDAANNVGTSAAVSVTLTTTASLFASTTASPTSGTAPLAVNFTGSASGGTSPYTYSWNFGDGSAASTAQNPSHTYSTAGTYTATLTVNDSAAHTASAMATVTVTNTPDTTPPSVPTGLSATAISTSQINLSWSASTDNVGVTGYKIYRNSVQIATSTTANYSDTGLTPSTTYSYTVSAFDAAGNNSAQSGSASATTMGAATLSASATASPTSGTAPLAVNFTGSASGGTSPYTYSWNFGDGSAVSTAQNPSHTYSTAGTYTATLTVNDSAAHTASASATVTVTSGGGTTTPSFTGSSVFAANVPSNQITLSLPVGTVLGEVLVAHIDSAVGLPGTITPPSGWNLVRTDSTVGQEYTWIYWHAYVSGDPSSYTWTFNGTGTYYPGGAMVAVQNANTSAPIDVTSGAIGNMGTVSAPSVTPTRTNDLLLATFGDTNGWDALTPPAGMTTAVNNGDEVVSYLPLTTANPTGGKSITGVTGYWTAEQIAIQGGTASIPPLSATASASPTSGVAPLAVNFTGSASGGTSPYTYSWNFGDGSAASTAQNPSHTYSTAGTYTATLTVNDSAAHTASASQTITVTSGGGGTTAPSFTGSSVSAASKPSKSLTLTRPAGTVSGEVLIAHVDVAGGTPGTITAPSGWNLVRTDSTAGHEYTWIYWHTYMSSDPASFKWNFSGNGTYYPGGAIVAVQNANTSTPIDVSSGTTGNTSWGSASAPSVTPTRTNDLLLATFGDENGWDALTPPASMTTAVNNGDEVVSYLPLTSANPTGVQSTAGFTGYWTAEQIAVTPAGAVLSANTFGASNSAALTVGARVQTTARLKVRAVPSTSGIVNCIQPTGTLGTIVDGPSIVNDYTWWNINYDTGCNGWSVQKHIVVITTAMASQTGTAIASNPAFPSYSQTADLSVAMKIQALMQQLHVLEQELQARKQ